MAGDCSALESSTDVADNVQILLPSFGEHALLSRNPSLACEVVPSPCPVTVPSLICLGVTSRE
jgi:hypothetical protein